MNKQQEFIQKHPITWFLIQRIAECIGTIVGSIAGTLIAIYILINFL